MRAEITRKLDSDLLARAIDSKGDCLIAMGVNVDRPVAQWVERLGGTMLRDRSPIRLMRLPACAVTSLAARPEVAWLRASRKLRLAADRARAFHRIDGYRTRTGRRGAGVLVAVVDSGVDGKHPAFAGRIARVWDQTVEGSHDTRVPIGALVEPENATDEDGHGTHVAAIAAGADANYEGVAPRSDLVVVKLSGNESVYTQLAIDHIFELAEERGQPAVVNLSLGGHWDPHDGSDPLSTDIDSLSGPGRIVVAAAGNEGSDGIHISCALLPETSCSLKFLVPDDLDLVEINLWYDGAAELEAWLEAPGGARTPSRRPNATHPQSEHPLDPGMICRLTSGERSPMNGDRQLHVLLTAAAEIEPGQWKLHLVTGRQAARVHAWLAPVSPPGGHAWQPAHFSHLIGTPGASHRAITVGAYVSRAHWEDAAGHPCSLKSSHGYFEGVIAPFSSPGPVRASAGVAYAEKPDVSAAGSMVISARSAQMTDDPPEGLEIDADHLALEGTSMAAPVITGLVATLLEQFPTWGPEEVREALRGAARGGYSPVDGFGPVWADRLG